MPVLNAPGRLTASDERLPPPVSVSGPERTRLLDIARWALAAAVHGQPELALARPPAVAGSADGEEHRGPAFVTLRVGAELRGCIGTLDTDSPWPASVARAAVSAALHDPRFNPVAEIELPAIELEVSLLGPLTVLQDPLAFRLGVDGLLVERGLARGLLLPEVAPTFGLDHRGMLAAVCAKAGLPPDAWRDPGTTVFAFQTAHFDGPARAIRDRAGTTSRVAPTRPAGTGVGSRVRHGHRGTLAGDDARGPRDQERDLPAVRRARARPDRRRGGDGDGAGD